MAVESAAVTYQFGEFEAMSLPTSCATGASVSAFRGNRWICCSCSWSVPTSWCRARKSPGGCGQLSPEIRWIRARYIDPVRTVLGAERFESARAEGGTMALGDAITLARQRALLLG